MAEPFQSEVVRRLLIIEDSPTERLILSDIMRQEGFETVACATGREALGLLQQHEFAVIIVDQRLPDVLGTQLLERLHTLNRAVRVILYTAFPSFDSAKDSVNLGAFAYVEKGSDPEVLIHHVQRAVQDRMHEALRETEEKYRQIVETTQEGVWMINAAAEIAFVNQRLADLLGYTVETMLRRSIYDYLPEEEHAEAAHTLARCRQGMAAYHECTLRRQDGSDLWVRLAMSPLFDDSGLFSAALVMVSDMTASKRTEQALRESEERYRALYEEAPNAYLSLDINGRIVQANRSVTKLLGYTPDDLIDRRIFDLYADTLAGKPKAQQICQRYHSGDEPYGEELEMRRADGSQVWISLSMRPVRDAQGAIIATRSIIVDITERKRLEQELLTISEQERRRLGQDLHDSLGQQLTGLALLSSQLERRLSTRDIPERTLMAQLNTLMKDVLTQTHDLAQAFYPVVLETEGLFAALDTLVVHTKTMYGLPVQLIGNIEPPWLPPDTHIHLYRIAQEALTNAVKHGRAQRVVLQLTEVPRGLQLLIDDDGVGLPDEVAWTPGMGMRIMHYRARLIGAILELQRRSGGGTQVSCTVPRPSGVSRSMPSP